MNEPFYFNLNFILFAISAICSIVTICKISLYFARRRYEKMIKNAEFLSVERALKALEEKRPAAWEVDT